MGFCFSFPVEQTGLASGNLIKLTKKFENEGAVGVDPVLQLAQALERKGMPVRGVSGLCIHDGLYSALCGYAQLLWLLSPLPAMLLHAQRRITCAVLRAGICLGAAE